MSFQGSTSPPKSAAPPPKPLPPAPSRADVEVPQIPQRRGRGRASTIITALAGQLPEGSAIRKTLLGGS